MLGAVKAGDIFEVVWASLLAASCVIATFSFVVLGMARSTEAARAGRGTAASPTPRLAVLALAAFAAAVVFGVQIMLTKD